MMPLFVAGRLRPRCLELADDRMANSRDFAADVAQPEDAEHVAAQVFADCRLLWHRLLGGQCLSLADYVTVTAPTGEAVAAGCC
jgi:hypothetical protein